MRLAILFNMSLNSSFEMTASFANVARKKNTKKELNNY